MGPVRDLFRRCVASVAQVKYGPRSRPGQASPGLTQGWQSEPNVGGLVSRIKPARTEIMTNRVDSPSYVMHKEMRTGTGSQPWRLRGNVRKTTSQSGEETPQP